MKFIYFLVFILPSISLAQEPVYSIDGNSLNSELSGEKAAFLLAEINLSNGNQILFVESPRDDSVHVGEIVAAGANETFILDQIEGDILQKYLKLTSQDTPVPMALVNMAVNTVLNESMDESEKQAFFDGINNLPYEYIGLLDLETQQLMAKRNMVIELISPINVDIDYLESKLNIDQNLNRDYEKVIGQGSCNKSTGYLYFQEHHCGTGAGGSGEVEEICAFEMHTEDFEIASSEQMRTTYSRHAACNSVDESGTLILVHYSKRWILWLYWWEGDITRHADMNAIENWYSTSWNTRERKVNFRSIGESEFARAWVRFTKNR